MYLFAVFISFLVRYLLRSLAQFLISCFLKIVLRILCVFCMILQSGSVHFNLISVFFPRILPLVLYLKTHRG